MQVQLLDEHREDHEVQGSVDDAEDDHERPVGLLDAEHQIGDDDIDDTAGGRRRDVQNLEQDEADAGQHGVDHEQHGGGEHEQEVHRLGDAGEDRGDDEREDDGAGLVAIALVGGHDERRADTQIGPQVVEGVAIEVGARGERLTDHGHLGDANRIGAGDNRIAQGERAAHIGELEGRVNEMVQAERDEQLVKHAVQEQADVATLLDHTGERGDTALHGRPSIASGHTEKQGDADHDQEREADAREHGKGDRELLTAELVEDPAGDTAQNDAAEDAHIEHLDAQDLALTGADQPELRGLSKHAERLEGDVVGIQEQEEGHETDERRMALVLLGHRAGDTSAENHREIVHDEHQAVVDDLAHGGKERQLQEGNHRGDGLIGEEDSQDQHGARHGQVHQRLDD